MTGSDLALRLFLPGYFVAYVLIAGVQAVVRVRRTYGVDPLAVAEPDPLMSLGESYRNVLFAAALLVACAHALKPGLLSHLGPISFLDAPPVQGAGVIVLLGSLVLVRAAQVQMKGSWRVGHDRSAAPTDLVTSGIFAWSRNPIYLGMAATGAGLFLTLPNAVTFGIAALTWLLLQVRVLVEEDYLRASHGEAFAAYCRETPRWLFRLAPDR
jgi:protein-S-isoprenylcysteine O-methyltransferase Ste14